MKLIFFPFFFYALISNCHNSQQELYFYIKIIYIRSLELELSTDSVIFFYSSFLRKLRVRKELGQLLYYSSANLILMGFISVRYEQKNTGILFFYFFFTAKKNYHSESMIWKNYGIDHLLFLFMRWERLKWRISSALLRYRMEKN